MTHDNKLNKERLTEVQMNMYIAQHIYTDEIKLDIYLTSTRHLACLKISCPKTKRSKLYPTTNGPNLQQQKIFEDFLQSKPQHFSSTLDDTQMQHIWPGSLSSKEASDIPLHQVSGEIRQERSGSF